MASTMFQVLCVDVFSQQTEQPILPAQLQPRSQLLYFFQFCNVKDLLVYWKGNRSCLVSVDPLSPPPYCRNFTDEWQQTQTYSIQSTERIQIEKQLRYPGSKIIYERSGQDVKNEGKDVLDQRLEMLMPWNVFEHTHAH